MSTILCQCCSDIAMEYEGSTDLIDGLAKPCDSCGILGRVSVDCDEGGVYVRFWPLTEPEAMRLENTVLIEAYLKGQDIIDKLMNKLLDMQSQNLNNEKYPVKGIN